MEWISFGTSLAVAILGISGVLIGQALTYRRDVQRDRDLLAAREVSANNEGRRAVYADLLGQLRAYRQARIDYMRTVKDPDRSERALEYREQFSDRLVQTTAALSVQLGQAALFASVDVAKRSRKLQRLLAQDLNEDDQTFDRLVSKAELALVLAMQHQIGLKKG